MNDVPTFQVRLNEIAFSRLTRIATKMEVAPESLFLFLALWTLRDIEDGRHHYKWYLKRFLQLEKDLKNEQEMV